MSGLQAGAAASSRRLEVNPPGTGPLSGSSMMTVGDLLNALLWLPRDTPVALRAPSAGGELARVEYDGDYVKFIAENAAERTEFDKT